MRDANGNREENLKVRSTRKEGLPPKPSRLNYVLLSQCKIWLAYARSVDNTSSFKIRETQCMQECEKKSRFLKIKLQNQSKSKRWNCVSLAMMFLRFCQQAMERVVLIFLAKLFVSNPNASMSVISPLINTRSKHSPRTIPKIGIDWAWPFSCPLKDWTRLSLETFRGKLLGLGGSPSFRVLLAPRISRGHFLFRGFLSRHARRTKRKRDYSWSNKSQKQKKCLNVGLC